MANYNKFNPDKYIFFGYNSYDDYIQNSAEKDNIYSYINMINNDAHAYLDLFENGYVYTVDDLKKILDVSNNNTVQTKIMSNIDKVYINKPVKDFLYLCVFDKNIPELKYNFTRKTGLTRGTLEVAYLQTIKRCYSLKLNSSFLIKKTFMSKEDVENEIKRLFKKEVIEVNKDTNEITKKYIDITDKELELIMNKGFVSEKTLRIEEGFSNLNQLQRRLSGEFKGELSPRLKGFIGKFVMTGDIESKRPLTRYLFDDYWNLDNE